MATKEARGTKRTCQNSECGSRFYDLNRDPVFCPICESEYRLAPLIVEEDIEEDIEGAEVAAAAIPAAPVASAIDAGDGEEVSDDAARVRLEAADAEFDGDTPDADDDTFLEEEDDEGGDVTGIIGAPVSDEDDES